jgi:hypothetical protein
VGKPTGLMKKMIALNDRELGKEIIRKCNDIRSANEKKIAL